MARKKAGRKYRDSKTTPKTKEKAARLHSRLSIGDEGLNAFIDEIEEGDMWTSSKRS